MYSAADLVLLNQLVGELGRVLKPNELESVFASSAYYNTDLERICSVARSLMQNHPFADGNKRTAVFFLLGCVGQLRANDEELADMAVQSVVQKWTVDQYVTWVSERL